MRSRSKRLNAIRDPASQMQVLAERTMGWDPGTSISFTHPTIAHLHGRFAHGGSWQDDFVDRAEGRLTQIENEVGVATL